jgi:hypothetical protein
MKLLWLIALFALAISARAEQPTDAVTVYARWKMSLDADGKIMSLALKPGRVKDVLRDALEKTIRSWEFEPGKENGVPAATETTLSVEVTIAPMANDKGYSIVVNRAETGGTVEKIGVMPTISWAQAQGMKRDKKAKNLLVLRVTYDPSGVAEDIGIADGSPITKGPLVESAMTAVRTWTFDPERVGGHGLRARVLVPICYEVKTPGSADGKCKWTSPEGDKSVVGGQSVALDSSVHLKTDVAGKTL